MYNNSNIQWHSGMEITPAVFRNLENDLTERQLITVRTAISDGRIGILPDTERNVEGGFVGRTYEMPGLTITALTHSGALLAIEEDLKIEIPKLTGKEYYLCVGVADEEKRTFERDGILYEAPVYELSLCECSDEEALARDIMPVEHFVIDDGTLAVDHDYIIPCLSLKTDSRFAEYRDKFATALEAITTHQNMDEGDCKRTLLSLLFRLKTFSMERPVRDFVDLLQEIALSVRYFVVDGLGKTLENCPESPKTLADDSRNVPSQYNISSYLNWMQEYLEAQQELMALVVIVDNSIDYEKLKAELREEIYGKLYDELYNKLYPQLHDTISQEITDAILNEVRRLVNEELHPELFNALHIDLHDPLYNDLFEALYKALYDALYKPIEQAKDEFMPLI